MQLTGERPKIAFGEPGAPTCELSLNKATSQIESTCEISVAGTRRRLIEDNYNTELEAVKSELADIWRRIEELQAQKAHE